ncbi:radical S-adenosyl methionine domain-containing protein 1, mitochondrial isoform X2 [Takifugu rubripes]|uniref:radical S-adenosyl methionine domain-containing protein 1, mitochondrial isoform X2 n=1 Tax=Takifugu rubripes TaxID=31033 RepID=UPI00114540D1|nr:radical S-adenosyl methionine domain-containing protein 1, mitochondrial isoform X2 [Takifugu rubripes]
MLKRTLQSARRVLSPGLRFLSHADGIEDRSRLTDHASLYVHWPYCLRRCTYCNFNKYISRENNEPVMAECLQREAASLLKLSQVSRITSVFFGGGTPSLAHPSTIAALLETLCRHASLAGDAEVTLEVNPTPVGTSKLEDYRRAGVNRFSIGVQSLQDDDLKVLGRDHTSLQALQTLERARSLCPGRVSVDVMFGRPGQSVESWEKELSQLLRVCDDHVSLYQLTLERGTQLFRQVERGEATLPAEGATAEMYRRARAILHQRGFLQLEEVLVMGMRMTEGISHKHWALFSPQLGLRDVFGTSLDVQDFLKSRRLILDHRGLRCSWEGLALLDSMLPALLVELEGRVRVSGHARGQTTPAATSPRQR